MTYKKVALVSLPRQDLVRPPASLPVLAVACEDLNTDYEIFDFNLWLSKQVDADTWDKIDANWMRVNSFSMRDTPWFITFRKLLDDYVKQMLNHGVDLIAISVFTDWSAHAAWEMIESIHRQRTTDVEIVIGGTGITARSLEPTNFIPLCNYLLDNGKINYYIYGEGEINFRNLLSGITSGPGINNSNAVQIDNLDQFPTPSYKKINPRDYNFVQQPSIVINGSRGCVRHCTYCDVVKHWPKFRYKSGVKLAQEIYQTWKTIGIKVFEFSDSLINGSIREFRLLNKELIRLKEEDPSFDINYRGQFICRASSQFKEEDYYNMHLAGCDYIYVGVETFSERVRLDMAKKFDNRALDFHLEQCAKYGIPNIFLMIVGYPTETEDDHQMNLDSLRKYQIYSQAGVIEMITFGATTRILRDTPLYLQKESLDIIPEFEDFIDDGNWISLQNPTLTTSRRISRWIELTELANELGYNQPRIDDIVGRFEQILETTKTKKRSIPILTEKL